MNNLEITVCVIAIAVAQVLTILLTIGRERDIKELREHLNELRAHLDEQRLRIVELRAWLAGRNAAQPSRIKSEREPIGEQIANNIKAPEPIITPKDLHETIQPRTTEDEAAQAMKAQNWSREIVASLRPGLKGGAPPEPATTPKDLPDTIRPSTTEDELKRATNAINWLKEDADKAREIVASLHGTPPEKIG